MSPAKTKHAPADRVAHVMRRTGCTQQQAVAELDAEEGNTADAVLNLNAAMRDDPRLMPRETWQCQVRGMNDQEYAIYVTNAESLGWMVRTYGEWLAS